MDWHAPDATTVFEYLERTLSASDQQAFEMHLRECSACQRELQAARRLEDLSRHWTQEEPPAQLREKISRQLKPQVPARAWLLAAAAAAAILLSLRGKSVPQSVPNQTTPPPIAIHHAPNLSETPMHQPLAAENVWTTQSNPIVIALSGQILRLSPHSQLTVSSHRGNHYLLRLSQGEVRVQEHDEVIAVETDHLRVDPMGTDYQVTRLQHSSRVHLYSGAVKVTALSSGRAEGLQPGQTIELPTPKAQPRPLVAHPAPQSKPELPGLAYPQRIPLPSASPQHFPPLPEPVPSDRPLWTEHPQNWQPRPEFRNPEPSNRRVPSYRPERRRPWQPEPGRINQPIRRSRVPNQNNPS